MKSETTVAILLTISSLHAEAQSCQNPNNYLPAEQAISDIRIVPGGDNYSLTAGTANALRDAMRSWNTACGSRVPKLSFGAPSPIVLHVNFYRGTYPDGRFRDRCGVTSSPPPGSQLDYGTVRLYETSINGANCTTEILELTMHELGHALGLGGNNCSDNIMWETAPHGEREGLRPTTADCSAVDDFWRSTEEPAPGSVGGDEGNTDNQCVEDCEPGGEPPIPGGSTPIVVSLLDARYELTSHLSGVFFDIDADEATDLTAWTVGGSDDAFLVLDRNSNGLIDDGTELFGGVTPQPPSQAPNGFAALAVFDAPENGGDLDGYISSRDAIFDKLRLWVDADHNGHSDAHELLTLSEADILFLDLAYGESRKVDEHGNEFRYWSMVGREADIITVWDVILRHW
ncbi:MAG: hypothetical protein AAF560_07710 [Acidobacteriota bacterium]